MTQSQLDRQVARRTGESLRTVRGLGFQLRPAPHPDLEPEDLHLAVACPHCGSACPLTAGEARPALAECDGCDLLFSYRDDEVVAAGDDGFIGRDVVAA